MASVTIRNLSEETKGLLAQSAQRNRHSLEEELRQILNATAKAEVGSADVQEPFGDWFFRITRPGFDELAENIAANRQLPDRPMPKFD